MSASGTELTTHGTPELPCGCYLCDPLVNVTPWHWHDEFEYVYVTCGELRYLVGNQRHLLREGDAVFVNAKVPHAEEPDGGRRAMEVDLVCNPTMLHGDRSTALWHRYFSRLALPGAPRARVLRHDGEPWEREASGLILKAWEALASKGALFELELREALTRATLLIIEHADASSKDYGTVVSATTNARIERMLTFMEDNFDQPLTLAQIAAAGGVSEREAQREFAETLGESPLQHLMAHRLAMALRLLLMTDETAGSIARRCGFSGQSYFNRCFREHYGCTPSQYRASSKGVEAINS